MPETCPELIHTRNEKGDMVTRSCGRQLLEGSDRCVFHDLNAWRTHAELIQNEIEEKIRKGDLNFQKYHLPKINFSAITREFKGPVDFSHAVFHGKVNFSGITFFDSVNFNHTEFLRTASFRSTIFSKNARFRDTKFTKMAQFLHANFLSDAWFTRSKFLGSVKFRSAKFCKDISFSNAEFLRTAFFNRATFSGRTWFTGAKFVRYVRFDGAEFTEVDFVGAIFSDYTRFDHATFSGIASFRSTTFRRSAQFSDTMFSEGALFDGVIFSGKTDFENAKFYGDAGFNGAVFSHDAEFGITEFYGDTWFEGATFSKPATFSGATFFGRLVSFERAKFLGGVRFHSAKFLGDAYFIAATFSAYACFDLSRFREIVVFDEVVMSDVIFNFRNVLFERGLSVDEGLWKGSGFRLKIEDYDLPLAAETYQALKRGFENMGHHRVAGELFYREMSCRKKMASLRDAITYSGSARLPKWLKSLIQATMRNKHLDRTFRKANLLLKVRVKWSNLFDWLWMRLFELTCGFGERPKRVLLGSMLTVLAFTVIYFPIVDSADVLDRFEKAFLLSLDAFTPGKFTNILFIPPGEWLVQIETVLGWFMLSLFLVVFTRKMSRG